MINIETLNAKILALQEENKKLRSKNKLYKQTISRRNRKILSLDKKLKNNYEQLKQDIYNERKQDIQDLANIIDSLNLELKESAEDLLYIKEQLKDKTNYINDLLIKNNYLSGVLSDTTEIHANEIKQQRHTATLLENKLARAESKIPLDYLNYIFNLEKIAKIHKNAFTKINNDHIDLCENCYLPCRFDVDDDVDDNDIKKCIRCKIQGCHNCYTLDQCFFYDTCQSIISTGRFFAHNCKVPLLCLNCNDNVSYCKYCDCTYETITTFIEYNMTPTHMSISNYISICYHCQPYPEDIFRIIATYCDSMEFKNLVI